ncbi:MAG TPA: hypothetical protein PKM73_00510 [Verrucomicrobiota bacterium]|nr:hypothetical protein [Verrucomicrobiota bacterium]HNU49822.1 hypothetical protein [Verrucomicrobiota bacterium]
MRIPPQTFFHFCAAHVPLLRALAEVPAELSEAEVRRHIRAAAGPEDELPETTWRRLNELQILVPVEPGSDFYFVADPVRRVVAYLFDEAQPTTPEIIRGYLQSLDALDRRLARAIEGDDLTTVRLALEEIQQTLRRIAADLDETHRCILAEVARYKAERQAVSVREKFRRIVHWMERYVDPMVDILRPDGPLRAAFIETDRLLRRARENGLFNDLPALDRNSRLLRWVERHALRVFRQCRLELQPLYESLRRASFMAAGAAAALDRLARDGPDRWAPEHVLQVCALRWQHVPSDAALDRALRNVAEHPPEPAPVLAFPDEDPAPAAYQRRLWLEGLPEAVGPVLPVDDLLGWLVGRNPRPNTADTLAGFSHLVFHPVFRARFTEAPVARYPTADGELEAPPVRLSAS